jgi:hypothetical protein
MKSSMHLVWSAIALHAPGIASFRSRSIRRVLVLVRRWVGELGILVMLTMIAAAVVFTQGRWTIRKFPEVSRDDVVARCASGVDNKGLGASCLID